MRQAIGDFLLGLDDLGIYALKQQLSKAESEFAKIDGQLDSIYRFVSPSEGVLRVAALQTEIDNATLELKRLLDRREVLLAQPEEASSDDELKVKAAQAGQEIAAELESTETAFAKKLNDAAKVLDSVAETLDQTSPLP